MYLYLMQHGKANPKEKDPLRGLSAEGIEESERVALRLSNADPEPAVIWHSTKLRSEETARIVAVQLKMTERLTEHHEIAPKDSIGAILNDLNKKSADRMIVGHLPFLDKLLTHLLKCGEEESPVSFRNSAVICLKKDKDRWLIQWILHPDFA